MEMKIVARIRTEFPEKFGIPRQSGLAQELRGRVVFEPEYRDPSAFRGLEEYSHLWLLWEFSESVRPRWSPTVRPPRLGGNKRMGVFATRSPFRPNPIGLSCVRLVRIETDPQLGPVLIVAGADLMDGTPIYDVKPYLPYVDAHPEAIGGFSDRFRAYRLQVVIPEKWISLVPVEKRNALTEVLANDPRPSYQNDPKRVYKMDFAGMTVSFAVVDDCLTVRQIEKHI